MTDKKCVEFYVRTNFDDICPIVKHLHYRRIAQSVVCISTYGKMICYCTLNSKKGRLLEH